MTEHETLLRLQYMYDSNNSFMVGKRKEIETAMNAIKEVQQYRAIGTVSEFRELKEKATPKKPSEIDERAEESFYYLAFMCPTCGRSVIGQPYRPNNCKHCGQKLDWSEGKE